MNAKTLKKEKSLVEDLKIFDFLAAEAVEKLPDEYQEGIKNILADTAAWMKAAAIMLENRDADIEELAAIVDENHYDECSY